MTDSKPSARAVSKRQSLRIFGALLFVAMLLLGLSLLGKQGDSQSSAGLQPGLAHAEPGTKLGWQVVGRGFGHVTDIQFVPGSPAQAIVVRKHGKAQLLQLSNEKGRAPAKAEDSALVFEVKARLSSELGLLGLAFHPDYEKNGLFYVNYNPADGEPRTRVSEWKLEKARLGKQPAKEQRVLLEVAQPYANHNGGQLLFGPDGLLYIGLGDGGAGGDPHDHGQNLSTLLGAMLRIDVKRKDPGLEYGIPKDNPFVKRAGARAEIWAYGLRNPWRYSFDPQGRLIVADVGQNDWEEVTMVERGTNHGWKHREGTRCYPPSKEACRSEGLVKPIFEYPRSQGVSITGGYVYLGTRLPELKGKYLVGDFGSGRVWALSLPASPGMPAKAALLGKWPRAFSTFGRDADGEIYAGDHDKGDILRLVRQ